MGGRGKRGKPTSNTNAGAGRGRAPPQQQYTPAPNPAQSAWQRSAPAPAPAQSPWGPPAPAPSAAQSAWGRQAPAAAPPTQSAWVRPTPASAPTPANGESSRRAPAESGGSGRPQEQRQQPREQQDTQQQSRQQGTRPEPRTYVGFNGPARKMDRGAVRDRKILYPDIVVTKAEGVSKRGSTGRDVILTTNHFLLSKRPDWQLYQYRVDFSPPIENKGFMKKLIAEQKINLGGYLFDGTMMFLCKKLHNDVTEFMSMDRDDNPIQIKVKFAQLISMKNGESVQILNLILRRSMAGLNLQLVGRNFFDPGAKITINQHNLQLWPGYETSIRQHETDILMCAQVAHKVMRTETVANILNKYYRRSENWMHDFSNAILGMTVLTEYNNKTYRIDDVTFEMTPMDTFDTRDGPISFVDYYRQKYGIEIRNPNQPMLITRSKERNLRGGEPAQILLIPELCRATGFTEEMRSNRRLMTDLAQYTRMGPSERIQKLNAFNARLRGTQYSADNFKEWAFDLSPHLVQLKGRVLPPNVIHFGNGQKVQEIDFTNAFRQNAMYSQQPLTNWAVIVPKGKVCEDAKKFVGILQKAANGMKYQIKDPVWIETQSDQGWAYCNAVDTALNRDPQLVMCILNHLGSDKYAAIKKKCCVEKAVPSQVMLSRTITPKPGKELSSLLSVGTKVAIQINAKLGGAPWMVDIPMSGTMVVGFDVCHDTNDKSKSYGALVATMDLKVCSSYFSAVTPHRNGEELCNNIALNLAKAVNCYGTRHKFLPDRICIYRDGVGEGQTDYVREHEIKAIQAQLGKLYKGNEYKLLFIVVSKRINTRFFRGTDNPSPGTVVDDVVTLPERHDFFMVSPLVRQGTVSPTNYNILYNTSKLSSDSIQLFTYRMTCLYYNWTSTLAVPAVCQYAHKLAFLVGNFIHQSPSHLLEKQLYFL